MLAMLALAGFTAYTFWFKDSSFVEVRNVEISGLEGGETEAIEKALTRAASEMTTLNFDRERLERAVKDYVSVKSLKVETSFPRTVRIKVEERRPALVAKVRGGGPGIPVSAEGLLMPSSSVKSKSKLPVLKLTSVPSGDRLEGNDLARARVLAEAPDPLVPLITGTGYDDQYGVVVELHGGIPVRFGDQSQADLKWASAAAVLSDPRLTRLTYLDVRAPERPAVGGATPA